MKCSKKFIPKNIIQNIFSEEDLNPIFEEILNNENFEKSEEERESFDSIERIRKP